MYTMNLVNETIEITLNNGEFENHYTIKKDEYVELIVTFNGFSENITRYNTIQEIVEDREYIINILEIYDKSGDFGNIFEELFYGNHFKGYKNEKVNVERNGNETTFKSYVGDITIHNDSCMEIGEQINVYICEDYIGTTNKEWNEKNIILGDINIPKIRNEIQNYINTLSYIGKDELLKMAMRLFPNHYIED